MEGVRPSACPSTGGRHAQRGRWPIFDRWSLSRLRQQMGRKGFHLDHLVPWDGHFGERAMGLRTRVMLALFVEEIRSTTPHENARSKQHEVRAFFYSRAPATPR